MIEINNILIMELMIKTEMGRGGGINDGEMGREWGRAINNVMMMVVIDINRPKPNESSTKQHM